MDSRHKKCPPLLADGRSLISFLRRLEAVFFDKKRQLPGLLFIEPDKLDTGQPERGPGEGPVFGQGTDVLHRPAGDCRKIERIRALGHDVDGFGFRLLALNG